MAGYTSQDPRAHRRPPKPAGYDSREEFLLEMRKRHGKGREADDHNERAGRDDAKFVIGEQWDPDVERKRKAKNKPVLTFDRLQALVAQVVNDRLMNETEIRVFPDKEGTKEIAEIREGLIRSIYKNSYADFARDEAAKYQVIGGQGAFHLAIEYASDDVFEQKICIKNTADPYAIVLDPNALDPTGGDAEWGFVDDPIPRETFTKRWPWAAPTSVSRSFAEDSKTPWLSEDNVMVTAYWQMITEGTKILALYQDGTTQDVTDKDEFDYLSEVAWRSGDLQTYLAGGAAEPYVREVPKRFARMYLCSGTEILEGPYDYPLSSIPIYRVSGWEVSDGERLYRWGLTRKLKDPLRLHNYWRSTQAEMLIATPRNKWLTTQAAVRGHETRWRQAPSSDDPFLFYNDGEEKPTHIPPPPLDAALMSEAQQTMQDLRDISNIHEASLGAPSNEVSKVAIQARQQISDVGTFIYRDRLRMADERCAKNINELISYIYDSQRIETIIGRDGKPTQVMLNSNQQTDVTAGKYSLTVTVGPATITKRQLAKEEMGAFMSTLGPAAEKYMDLFAKAQDFPDADEFARRARLGLPPGYIPEDELTEEEKQMQAQNQQMLQLQQQVQAAEAKASIAETESKAAYNLARAEQAKASAYKAILEARARVKDVDSKTSERELQAAMDLLDQHNNLESEDRAFVSAEDERTRNSNDGDNS